MKTIAWMLFGGFRACDFFLKIDDPLSSAKAAGPFSAGHWAGKGENKEV